VFFNLKPYISKNKELEKLFETLRTTLEQGDRKLTAIDFLQGKLIENVAVVSGTPITIYHGLDRVPKGWIPTRVINGAVWLSYEMSRDNKTLVLGPIGTGNVDIWVF
jgi:hypothetical protein